jgi:hypothetical protein
MRFQQRHTYLNFAFQFWLQVAKIFFFNLAAGRS